MPQPTKYNRQYNFTDFQSSSPSNPLPATQVDGELNAVKTNLDGLNTNIGLIQRDDGKLGNASVGTQQFDNGALALIGASGSGFTIKGDWASATPYVVGDVVENSQATFYCSEAHTSGNAFSDNDSKFVLIANAAISSAAIQVEKFTGDGTTVTFTLSTTYGSDKDVMVFVNGSLKTPQSESSSTDASSYTISGNNLTFVTAPPNSTPPNVFVWGTSVSVEAARQSALSSSNTASGHSVDAGQHRTTANRWATKVDGTVVDEDTSVDSNEYSAKAYSISEATPTTIYVTVASSKFVLNGKTISSGSDSIYNIVKGTTYTFDVSDSTNSGHQLEFSTTAEDTSPDYTVTRSGTPGQAGATVTFAVPSDAAATVYFYCSVSGHTGMGATLTSISESYAPASGSSKEWASKVDGQVSGSEYSSKAYANSTDVNEPPTGSAKSWATQDTTAVASSLFSAKEYASGTSATGGTAKEWAQKTGSAVDTDYSSKVYAQDTALGADTSGGSAKGWASTAKNTAVPGASSTDRSAKHYSEIAADEATNALNQNRFLAPKPDTNVPTTRDDGTTALSTGDMYFNTTQNKMKIRNASGAWQDTSASIEGVASTTEYTGSQATNSKWFAFTHDVGLQIVWLNGVRQVQGSDYYSVNSNTSTTNIASGEATHIYFISNVASTDVISAMGFGQITSTAVVPVSGGNFTGAVKFNQDGNNTSFTLPTTRGSDTYVLTRDDSVGTGGTAWKETISAPSITNVSGEINEDTNTTLTVTGSGFASGMTIKLINSTSGADITGHTTLSYTGSSSPITVTIPSATQNNTALGVSTSLSAGLSVKLHITKSGLTTESNAIVVSEDPNWSTNAGNIATIYSDLGTNVNVGSALSATAGAGGGTINYVIDPSDTSATTYFDLGLTSGQITTDASNTLSNILGSDNTATETFIAYAQIAGEEATKKTPRTFNIIVNKAPVITNISNGASNIFTYASGTHKVIRFTAGTTDIEFFGSIDVDLMVVGGGGGGATQHSGGGGGGGILYNHPTNAPNSSTSSITIPAGTYRVIVGAATSAASGQGTKGAVGNDSSVTYTSGSGSFTTYTAGGGGGGGSHGSSNWAGLDGRANHGSGGGGGSDSGSGGGGNGEGHSGGGAAAHATGGGGGGGGGAGASGSGGSTSGSANNGGVGTSSYTNGGGNGGSGCQMGTIYDGVTNHYWAGGGGGGAIQGDPNSAGDGGAGGGGGGGMAQGSSGGQGAGGSGLNAGSNGNYSSTQSNAHGGAGGANTGGGGGGSGSGGSNGGAGGSGIVLIRYAI